MSDTIDKDNFSNFDEYSIQQNFKEFDERERKIRMIGGGYTYNCFFFDDGSVYVAGVVDEGEDEDLDDQETGKVSLEKNFRKINQEIILQVRQKKKKSIYNFFFLIFFF